MNNAKTNEHVKSFQMDGNPVNILHMADSFSMEIKNALIMSELKKKESAIFPNQFVSSTRQYNWKIANPFNLKHDPASSQ